MNTQKASPRDARITKRLNGRFALHRCIFTGIQIEVESSRLTQPMTSPTHSRCLTAQSANRLPDYLLKVASCGRKPSWHFNVGELVQASSMSYAVSGKQYFAVAAGSNVFSFCSALIAMRASFVRTSFAPCGWSKVVDRMASIATTRCAAKRGKYLHQQPLLPDMAELINTAALKETVMYHA